MMDTLRIVDALKKALKTRGLTYRDLAPRLGLSEASVKRIFAKGDFSLERLETICQIAGLELSRLMRLAFEGGSEPRRTHFTMEQEQALARDPVSFAILHKLLQGVPLARIKKEMRLAESEKQRALAVLERLNLISQLSSGRIRFLVPRLVRWTDDGPLFRKYSRTLIDQFFSSPFTAEGEYVRLLWASLSARTRERLMRKILAVVKEAEESAEMELEQSAAEAQPVGIILAFRPVEFRLVSRR